MSLLDNLSSGSNLLPHLEVTIYKATASRSEDNDFVLAEPSSLLAFVEYNNKQIKLQDGTDYMSDTKIKSFTELAEGMFIFLDTPSDPVVTSEALRIKAVKATKSNTSTLYEAYL